MKNSEMSLTDYLLVLIVVFLGLGLLALNNINKQLSSINSAVNNLSYNSFSALFHFERNFLNKPWTDEDMKKVIENHEKFWEVHKRNN